ncbi:MAG TPA: hypothetical protein QGF58_25840 [Myxococcota bacterium]|nr:hypothetical protein [Myxococcota bacterium]
MTTQMLCGPRRCKEKTLDVVVDQEGVVRFVDTRYDPDTIEALIDELLSE